MNKMAEVNDHFEKSLEYKTNFEDLSNSSASERHLKWQKQNLKFASDQQRTLAMSLYDVTCIHKHPSTPRLS